MMNPDPILTVHDHLRLRLLRLLARGSSGNVFLASSQTPPDSPPFPPLVAVKAFSKARGTHLLQRCLNEEAVLLRIRQSPSPFLPTLHCTFEDAHFRYLVLDYFSGGDLHSLRYSLPDRRFSCDAIRFYAAEIVLALEHLHGCGVVHRDLKPENIMLTSEGHIVLTDFDVSAILDDPPADGNVDVDGRDTYIGRRLPKRCVTDGAINLETSKSISSCRSAHADWLPADEEQSELRRNKSCSIGKIHGAAKPIEARAEGGKVSKRARMRDMLLMRNWSLRKQRQRNPATRQDRVTPAAAAAEEESKGEPPAKKGEEEEREIVGTDEYLAPEVVAGEAVAEAADWWAVGVLVYEMVYGGTPFKGRSSQETLARVAEKEEEVQCQGLSEQPELRQLMAELLVKEARRRRCSLRNHPFFRQVKWSHLPQGVLRPPFLPSPPVHNHYEDHHHDFINYSYHHPLLTYQ